MAVPVRSCWKLALSACLLLTVSADCGMDCTYCIHHLQLQLTYINSLTCTLECEGVLSPKKFWNLCEDVLQARNAGDPTEGHKATTETSKSDNDPHYLTKTYSGFMKRYGGFMKKTAELHGLEPDNINHDREIIFKRYGGFMKKSLESAGSRNTDGAEKHHREILSTTRQNLDMKRGMEELQKRYGGFMRRVGRPDWKEKHQRYGGFLKRSWEEGEDMDEEEKGQMESDDITDVKKRYGGFMGY